MKIQCDYCERSEAAVMCCADEAALCWVCDDKVHAANKLAGKHHRVLLLPQNPNSSNNGSNASSSRFPLCDVCQEKAGFFFCLQDRALLCRHCDVSIHAASPYVCSHTRFLITGVRVSLQSYLTKSVENPESRSNGSSSTVDNPTSLMPSASPSMKKLRTGSNNLTLEEHDVFRSTKWPWDTDDPFENAGFYEVI